MKYFIIVNPISGRGRGSRLIPAIETLMRGRGLDYTLAVSQRPQHAIELAFEAAKRGFEAVLAMGGDGTSNEVINGLLQAQAQGFDQTALGTLCAGTGNDFSASLNLPTDPAQTIAALGKNIRKRIDIGLVKGCLCPEGRYFGNCVGIGFDAAGTIQSRKITWASGMLAYLVSAFLTIFFYYKAPTLQIATADTTATLPALLVSIMNGRRIGGGFWTAPDGKPDDGLLDICVARQVNRFRMLELIYHFIKGTQASQPEIQTMKAARVNVTAIQGSMPVQMDGEIIGETCRELSVEILPNKLEVLGYSA